MYRQSTGTHTTHVHRHAAEVLIELVVPFAGRMAPMPLGPYIL